MRLHKGKLGALLEMWYDGMLEGAVHTQDAREADLLAERRKYAAQAREGVHGARAVRRALFPNMTLF